MDFRWCKNPLNDFYCVYMVQTEWLPAALLILHPAQGHGMVQGTQRSSRSNPPPWAQRSENFMEASQEKPKRKLQKFSDPNQLHWKKGSILKGHKAGRMFYIWFTYIHDLRVSLNLIFNLFSLSVVTFLLLRTPDISVVSVSQYQGKKKSIILF